MKKIHKSFREYMINRMSGKDNRKKFHVVETKSGKTFVKYDEIEIKLDEIGVYVIFKYKGSEIDKTYYGEFYIEVDVPDSIHLTNLTGFYEFKIT